MRQTTCESSTLIFLSISLFWQYIICIFPRIQWLRNKVRFQFPWKNLAVRLEVLNFNLIYISFDILHISCKTTNHLEMRESCSKLGRKTFNIVGWKEILGRRIDWRGGAVRTPLNTRSFLDPFHIKNF